MKQCRKRKSDGLRQKDQEQEMKKFHDIFLLCIRKEGRKCGDMSKKINCLKDKETNKNEVILQMQLTTFSKTFFKIKTTQKVENKR